MIAYLVLRLLFDAIDGILQPGLEAIFDRKIPGLGAVIILILVYVVGLLSAFFLGKWLIRLAQNTLLRVPVISAVYSSAKQLIESFSGSGSTGFKRVVVIEYPRAGVWTIGFLTGTTTDEGGRTLALVYIPTAPTPNSGWVAILPFQDVFDTDLSVQQALRLVLSGGIVAPPQISKRAAAL
jgi:uncharacterized membrane protein